MGEFVTAVASLPGRERLARAPHGAKIIIHATAADTDGALGMWETFTAPGKGPEPHIHTRETEVFRVIEGTYRFRCGAEEFEAGEGAVVVLPPHVEHSWTNITDAPGRMFGMVTPGGFEQLFLEIEARGASTPQEIAIIEKELGLINDETRKLG